MGGPISIGGYFGIELGPERNRVEGCLAYSCIRAAVVDCFAHLDHPDGEKRLWFPRLMCPDVVVALQKFCPDIRLHFYSFDFNLRPIIADLRPKDFVYLYSPFGLTSPQADMQCEKVIRDCAHDFFWSPLCREITVLSPRKFFGVPDGAFLLNSWIDKERDPLVLDEDAFYLLRRLDGGAESAFTGFRNWEARLFSGETRGMSRFSRALFSQIDLGAVKQRRRENFVVLHSVLAEYNLLRSLIDERLNNAEFVPFSYPFKLNRGSALREHLKTEHIYTPYLWSGLADLNEIESSLVEDTVHCPIDQRYGENEMSRMTAVILRYLNPTRLSVAVDR